MLTQTHLRSPLALYVLCSVALLICVQELLVVAEQLVPDGGCLVVAGEVAHVGEDVTSKVDVATPAVGFIILLIVHKTSPLDHLSVQAKDVQRRVVAAHTLDVSMAVAVLVSKTK